MSPSYYADASEPRRVKPGEGAVTPIQALTVEGERLTPNVSRLTVEHEWVEARPELFRPVRSDDKRTRARHRAMLERARRQLNRSTRSTRPPANPSAPTSSTTSMSTTGGLRLPRDEYYPPPLRLPQ